MELPTAKTRLITLLGDPVEHSHSPRMQNAAFRDTGVDGVYVALRCEPKDFGALLRAVAHAGGGGNVTVPHKRRAATSVEVALPAVERTDACNTFWLEGGRVHGDNTDVTGFREAARTLIGPAAGARVLLLGAGGAARAALCALIDERADAVDVLNRTPANANELRDALDPDGRRVRVVEDRTALGREGYDLIVNATPLGLAADDPLPLDLDEVRRAGAMLDLVYGTEPTAWVRHARSREVSAADGTEMLVRQGAAAFERWWGREAPVETMRKMLSTITFRP